MAQADAGGQVKVVVTLEVEVDPDEWAAESQITASSTWREDVKNDVRHWAEGILKETQTIGLKDVKARVRGK